MNLQARRCVLRCSLCTERRDGRVVAAVILVYMSGHLSSPLSWQALERNRRPPGRVGGLRRFLGLCLRGNVRLELVHESGQLAPDLPDGFQVALAVQVIDGGLVGLAVLVVQVELGRDAARVPDAPALLRIVGEGHWLAPASLTDTYTVPKNYVGNTRTAAGRTTTAEKVQYNYT